MNKEKNKNTGRKLGSKIDGDDSGIREQKSAWKKRDKGRKEITEERKYLALDIENWLRETLIKDVGKKIE